MSQYSEQILTDICNMHQDGERQIMEVTLEDFREALREDWDDVGELEMLAENLQRIKSVVNARKRQIMRRKA